MSTFYCSIIPNARKESEELEENNSFFLCPTGTIMTGRYHLGDENGKTIYQYATLKAIDEEGNSVEGKITIENIVWSDSFKESSGNDFQAGTNRVLVGRKHSGDENGRTQYATAIVKIGGIQAIVTDTLVSEEFKESTAKWFVSDDERFLIGRYHKGDENGKTKYTTGKLIVYIGDDPAPKGTIIIPDKRNREIFSSESDSSFLCPSNTVLTGRSHLGDENGRTSYEYASLKAIDPSGNIVCGRITVEDIKWDSNGVKEDAGLGYDAPVGRVIVGRIHKGDETALTYYATGVVKFNGRSTEIRNYAISEAKKESGGWNWFIAPNNNVITGRHHYGDENGKTYYGFGTIFCDETDRPKERFRIIVAMCSDDTYMPMSPNDFIVLSRFRRHVDGASDDGYNKETGTFIIGNNDHTDPYYNIPISVINDAHLKGEYSLYTLRPFNEYTIGYNELFLEPDENLHGDFRPNGRVPAYYYSADGITPYYGNGTLEISLFFAYNFSQTTIVGPVALKFSHQGDWEKIILQIEGNKIKSASLSQHDGMKKYDVSKLDISIENGIQVLTIYSAAGTHALYKDVGDTTIKVLGHDIRNASGIKWRITDMLLPLKDQAWKLYSGAWGEKGLHDYNTGPIGPWYNRADKWTLPSVDILDIIDDNEYIIEPYDIKSEVFSKESEHKIETPENRIIIGRCHYGDENGKTIYYHAALRAKDRNGKIIEGKITVENRIWITSYKESDSYNYYVASGNRLITGRIHNGDENGKTQYQLGTVLFNGIAVSIDVPPQNLYPNVSKEYVVTENLGMQFVAPEHFVMTGRTHSGDETSTTTYHIGYIHIKKDLIK